MYYLIGLAGSFALFALFVASRPAAYRIARSEVINAPSSLLFGLINDFHQWGLWSPWDKNDPNMKKTFEGPESGVGAIYRWSGNNKVGEGSMTIIESAPTKILVDLKFLRPFPSESKAIFTLEPAGDGTNVTWAVEGNNAFMAKAFGVFVNMDNLLGADFANGLASMKKVATEAR